MPRKKKDEETVETNAAETAENGADEAAVEAQGAETEATDAAESQSKEASNEQSGILSSIVETVSAAVETVTETVSGAAQTVAKTVGLVSDDAPAATGRGNRAERIGTVTSDKMMKTVVVRVDRLVKHPKYRKYVRRKKNFMAHDELGAGIGDKVRIVETRPLSARKRWRVVEIVQKAAK
jgi:small subunit ribosomal protein S17